eukprot:938632-Amphidinium_carterae.1
MLKSARCNLLEAPSPPRGVRQGEWHLLPGTLQRLHPTLDVLVDTLHVVYVKLSIHVDGNHLMPTIRLLLSPRLLRTSKVSPKRSKGERRSTRMPMVDAIDRDTAVADALHHLHKDRESNQRSQNLRNKINKVPKCALGS